MLIDTQTDWWKIFDEVCTVWRAGNGSLHAAYESATKHASFYFNTDVVVSLPPLIEQICEAWRGVCETRNLKPDWVIGYAANVSCGLPLAYKMAELLRAQFGYVDLRRDVCCFLPQVGQTVLLVTDDVHSGGSVEQTVRLVESVGAIVLPVLLTMANFSGQTECKGLEIYALAEQNINVWPAADCPLCRQGSRAVSARPQWRELLR